MVICRLSFDPLCLHPGIYTAPSPPLGEFTPPVGSGSKLYPRPWERSSRARRQASSSSAALQGLFHKSIGVSVVCIVCIERGVLFHVFGQSSGGRVVMGVQKD